MRKRLKRAVALLLCAATIGTMAACSSGQSGSSAASGESGKTAAKGGKTVELCTCWSEGEKPSRKAKR